MEDILNIPPSFNLDPDDWENIPSLIPSILQKIQGEIYSVMKMLKETFHVDKVLERKFDLMEEIDVVKMKLAKNAADTAKAIGEVRSLGNIQEDIWGDYTKLQRLSEKTLEYVKNTKGSVLGKEDSQAPQHDVLSLWNINSLKKLIIETINESSVKKSIELWEHDLAHIDEEVQQLLKFNEKLVDNVNREVELLHSKIANNIKVQDKIYEDIQNTKAKFFNTTEVTSREIESLKKEIPEIKTEITNNSKKIIETTNELQSKSTFLSLRIDNSIKRIKKRKQEIIATKGTQAKFINELQSLKERMTTQEALTESFNEIAEQQARLKEFERDLAKSKSDLKEIVNKAVEAIKMDAQETKMEVCRKFDENDKEIKGVLKNMENVTKSLEDWALKVIKPAQSNEAKMFALEARIREEEDQRMQESNKAKDQLKKIIYALEQYGLGIVNKENQGGYSNDRYDKAFSEDESEEQSILPPLVQRGATPQRKYKDFFDTNVIVDPIQPQRREFSGPEIMLLRRLNFVKKLIDGQASHTAISFAKAMQLTDQDRGKRRFRSKRRVKMRKNVPNLMIEAKKVVQEVRKKNLTSKDRDDAINKTVAFDYRSEKNKYGSFKNYVALINENEKEELPAVFYNSKFNRTMHLLLSQMTNNYFYTYISPSTQKHSI